MLSKGWGVHKAPFKLESCGNAGSNGVDNCHVNAFPVSPDIQKGSLCVANSRE